MATVVELLNGANNYRTELAADLTAGATSMEVKSAAGAPSVPFELTLIDAAAYLEAEETQEVVKVTNIVSTTFTIERAQGGTSAMAFSTDDVVEKRITATDIQQLVDALTDGLATLHFLGLNPIANLQVFRATGGTNNGNILFSYNDTLPAIIFRQGTTSQYSVLSNASGAGTGGGVRMHLANFNYLIQDVAGNILASFRDAAATVFNESGIDQDTRFEGDSDQNLLVLDASTDRIGVGTNAPAAKFHVNGTIRGDGNAEFTALPTSDPGVPGRLWDDSGTVKISQ